MPSIAIPCVNGARRIAVILALVLAGLTRSGQGAVLPSEAVVEGRTLSEWSVEAWKWVYSLPIAKDPSLDCEGRWANERQPQGNVFFIAPLNGQIEPPCVRTFNVPANKYVLAPLLVITGDNIDTVPPLPIEQLYDLLGSVTGEPEDLYAFIDGVAVTNLHDYRATTAPFNYYFPDADNHLTASYGHPVVGLVDPVISDGYWLLVEPLAPGTHVLHTGGRLRGVPFFQPHEIVANITVLPPNRPPRADASATPLRSVSVNPAGTAVALNGSRSTDPDHNPLTFAWSRNGTTIATGVVATVHLPLGAHPISLIVSDGEFQATNSIVLEVIGVATALRGLAQALESEKLPAKTTRTLLDLVMDVERAIERGRFEFAINRLTLFGKRVGKDHAGLDAALAAALRQSAQEIILGLEAR